MGLCEVPATAMTREPTGSVTFPRKHGLREVSIVRLGVQIERTTLDASGTGADDRGHGLTKAGVAYDKHPEAGK